MSSVKQHSFHQQWAKWLCVMAKKFLIVTNPDHFHWKLYEVFSAAFCSRLRLTFSISSLLNTELSHTTVSACVWKWDSLSFSRRKKGLVVVLPSVEDPDRSMTTYTFPSGSKSICNRQRETQCKSVRSNPAEQRVQQGAFLQHKQTQEVIIFNTITLIPTTHCQNLHYYFHF